MNKRFLKGASLSLAAGALAIGVFRWWPRANEDSADVTQADILEATRRVHGQVMALRPASPLMDLSRKLRLAIGSLGVPDEENRTLDDLVTASLTGTPGLEVVERQSLDKVLAELNISLSGLVRAKEALTVGRLLQADWFLFGTEARLGSTNAIVLRLVDARVGVLRDAGIVPLNGSPMNLGSAIAHFVQESREAAANGTPRTYLAVGTFEDLSVNNRLAGFSTQIRGALIAAYRSSQVTLLEREYVDALLKEVRLDLAGLTAGSAELGPQRMQAAFWLVTGQYQSYETTHARVELVLDIQQIFGPNTRVKFPATPAGELSSKIKQAIDRTMARGKGMVLAPTRTSEARAEMEAGKEIEDAYLLHGDAGLISNNSESAVDETDNFSSMDESIVRRRRNLEEAIRAFETVLLLEPGSHEARMCLAAGLRDRTIYRIAEARDYYREIIDDTVSDRWSGLAQEALLDSFNPSQAAEAADWFGSAAHQATNPRAAKFYQDQAEAARALCTMKTGDRVKAELVAEEHLFHGIQDFKIQNLLGKPSNHSNFGDDYGYLMGMYQYAKFFGNDHTTAAQKLAALLPKMRTQAPDLGPYLLATVVSFQVSTDAPVVGEFERSLNAWVSQPKRILKPQRLWGYMQWLVCNWCFEHTNYDLMVKLLEAERRAGEGGSANFDDDARLRLAYAYLGTRRWKGALDMFETFGNQAVNAPVSDGPWGNGDTMIRTDKLAAYCRTKLGLTTSASDSRLFEMGPNCICMHTPSTFTIDKDGLWLAIAGRLVRLDFGLRTNFVADLPIGETVPITCICAGRNNIWIGTAGAGLVEYEKTSGECHLFTVTNGLLKDFISSLHETDHSLWIGYGWITGGALGRLDLGSQTLTSFMSSMFASRGEPPPRGPVCVIAGGIAGDLFIYADGRIRKFRVSSDSWAPAPSGFTGSICCFAANGYLVGSGIEIPQLEVESDTSGTLTGTNGGAGTKLVLTLDELSALEKQIGTNRGGSRIIKTRTVKPKAGVNICDFSGNHRRTILDAEAMPNVPTSLMMTEAEVWAGGQGFIARINLSQNRVTAFCRIPAESVERIQVGGGYLWAQYGGHLHRVRVSDLP